jgi:8-oxo-dGTP pyrophosphatase MutT (NUDIX family)
MAHTKEPGIWATISKEYLFNRPWLTMRQDTVQLPNGRIIDDYYVWEFPEWISVLAFTPQDEAVLIRQYRHGLGTVSYELPAGVHDKPGETLLQAAQRELLEETGFGGGNWQMIMELSPNPALQNNISYTFLARGVTRLAEQDLDATEEISVHLLPEENLRSIALEGGMIQALHIAPILKYLLLKEQYKQ